MQEMTVDLTLSEKETIISDVFDFAESNSKRLRFSLSAGMKGFPKVFAFSSMSIEWVA